MVPRPNSNLSKSVLMSGSFSRLRYVQVPTNGLSLIFSSSVLLVVAFRTFHADVLLIRWKSGRLYITGRQEWVAAHEAQPRPFADHLQIAGIRLRNAGRPIAPGDVGRAAGQRDQLPSL